MGHFWYMPMIIGLYLFLPIISNALSSLSEKTVLFPVAVVFVLTSIIPVLSVLSGSVGGPTFGTILDLGFSGGLYGSYMLLGFLVKRGYFKRFSTLVVLMVGFLSFSLVVAMQFILFSKGVDYAVWYSNCFLIIAGLCLFELVSRLKNPISGSLITSLSKYSFAIYLVHFPILMILTSFIGRISTAGVPEVIEVAILLFTVLVSSWVISILISKIPKLGSKLLYMR